MCKEEQELLFLVLFCNIQLYHKTLGSLRCNGGERGGWGGGGGVNL